jgi:hypothetical protein
MLYIWIVIVNHEVMEQIYVWSTWAVADAYNKWQTKLY